MGGIRFCLQLHMLHIICYFFSRVRSDNFDERVKLGSMCIAKIAKIVELTAHITIVNDFVKTVELNACITIVND